MKFMFTPFFLFFFWLFEFFLSEVVNTINKYCVFIQKLSLFESSQRNQSGGHKVKTVLDAVLIKSLGFLFKLK